MEFSCNSNKLKNSIAIVERAVASKSSLQVLENIFLEINQNSLQLRGNNLEIGIQNMCDVSNTSETGSVLVNAKTMSGILSKIDNQDLQIKVNDQKKLSIKGKKIDFDILGSNTEDYPVFPAIEDGVTFSIPVSHLRELIKYTLIAVSYDETKQFLNGILMKNEEDKLVCVATDGYRLACKKQTIVPIEQQFNVIIPFKAVNELFRILQTVNGEDSIQVTVSQSQIAFKMPSFLLISRLIQGQFPDYKQVIPTTTENTFKVSREAFLSAAERSSIIAAASNNVVRFLFSDSQVSLQANAKGLGDFKEEIDIERKQGQGDVKIAFNIRLLLDVIKTIPTEFVHVSFNNELSPCKILQENEDSFTYIIMPIRTADYQSE